LGSLWLKNVERPVEAFVLWPAARFMQADQDAGAT
jgi:hypothetical protein